MKFHSTLSKAFDRSNFRARWPFFFLEFFVEWMSSWAIILLSVICLPGRKADWLGEIILLRMGFNLLARIFEMSLYMVLLRLIGLKLVGLWGVEIFGIRVMKE